MTEQRKLEVTQIAFHQAEFVALKAEIAELVKSNAANFQYAVIASAGVFAWIAGAERITDHKPLFELQPGVLHYVFWLPVTIATFFGLMSIGIASRIRQMGSYLEKLEEQLGENKVGNNVSLGWESFFQKRFGVFGVLYSIGWVVLLGGNVYLAISLPMKPPSGPTQNAPAPASFTPAAPTAPGAVKK